MNPDGLTRRQALAVLAVGTAGALAGCAASPDATTPDATTEAPPGDGGPGTDDAGETSLAGSCGALFGDTDQRYDAGDRELVAGFAYPMGGTVAREEPTDDGRVTEIRYGGAETSQHSLVVVERGPLDGSADPGSEYAAREGWSAWDGVTVGANQRTVAIRRSENGAVTALVGVEAADGTHALEVRASAVAGAPCPEVYEGIVRRVVGSLEPRT